MLFGHSLRQGICLVFSDIKVHLILLKTEYIILQRVVIPQSVDQLDIITIQKFKFMVWRVKTSTIGINNMLILRALASLILFKQ